MTTVWKTPDSSEGNRLSNATNIIIFPFRLLCDSAEWQSSYCFVCLALVSMIRTDALYAPITYVTSHQWRTERSVYLDYKAPQTRVLK
ncbi:unnamed protein product [Linum tenue]|uniref:Uncharacterized protein n=1 Tax=Linum tenue TaxID=586396 RepID=A0AAV0GZK0_9ROSI|nr:unnamed protein product [Linum tenue]